MFITLPKVFSGLSAGTFVGILFFFLVLCAALTSSIALTESAVSTFQDQLGWGRKKSTVIVTVIMITLGTLSCLGYGPLGFAQILGMQMLDFFDFLTNSVMMPIAAIATCLLVSRVVGVKKIEEEMTAENGTFKRKENIQFHDKISVSSICGNNSYKLGRKRFRNNKDVTKNLPSKSGRFQRVDKLIVIKAVP